MIPHGCIHRRAENDRALESKIQSGQKVVCNSLGKVGEKIRGGGHHHQQVMFPCHCNVLNRAGESTVRSGRGKQIGNNLPPAESGEGKRLDELLRTLSHHDLNRVAANFQGTHQFRTLVSRDAAANPENNAHANARLFGG